MEHFLSADILSIISEYLNDVKDYLNLLQINKFVYYNILGNDSNNKIILNSELFQNKKIILSKNIPKYLFNIERLNLYKKGNDFNLLYKFKYIKSLKIKKLKDLINIPNLEELYIKNSILQPITLSNLKKLKILNLNNCDLNDNCLKELKNLTKLSLNYCKTITGECLQNFSNLTTLKTFYSVTDQNFYKFIGNLKNLQKLRLFENNTENINFLKELICLKKLIIDVTEFEEKYLFNLQNLQNLIIFGKGSLDNCFNYLTKLKELYCDFHNIVNFNKIKNIKNLKIRNFREDISEEKLQNFTNIIEFNAYYMNHFTGIYLNNNLNLTTLHIPSCKVKDEYLINLINLKDLNLSNCKQITGKCLQNMKFLEELNISVTVIEDKYLKNLIQLKQLKLTGCQYITGDCLQYLINLEILYIWNTNIKDEHLLNLLNLKEIVISNCKNITGKCLLNLNNLKILDCEEINIKDEYLFNLNKLRELNISNCKVITGECLLHLKHLKVLKINYTNIKEEYLTNLVNLKELSIIDCPNIINGQFLLNLKKLNFVKLINYSLSKNSVYALKKEIRKGKTLEEIAKFIETIIEESEEEL
ncbi:hypothetical protein ABK040_003222 [Willaertia magna]